MAIPENLPPAAADYTIVTKSPKHVLGGHRRDPEGVKVRPSGVTELNSAGSDLFDEIARSKGLEPGKCGVILGGNEEKTQVSCFLVDDHAAGAGPVRRGSHGLTLYLSEVFAACPKLRPVSVRWCTISARPDGAGSQYILIALNSALARRTVHRKPATQA